MNAELNNDAIRYVTRRGNGECVLTKHYNTFNLKYAKTMCIHSDPPVFTIDNFLTSTQCDSYVSKFNSNIGRLSGQASLFGKGSRTSSTRYLDFSDCLDFVDSLQLLLGVSNQETFEEPQIVRYAEGQQFTWHYDAIQPNLQDSSGNRMVTAIVYLNDLPAGSGGETCFRDLEICVTPVKGRALVFFPSFIDGLIDDRTLHCGMKPNTGNTKYIIQCWVRQFPYLPQMRDALIRRQADIAKLNTK